MNTVELSVRSDLLRIANELKLISDASDKSTQNVVNYSKEVGKQTEKQLKNTETFLGKLRRMSGNIAHEMAEDFKALFNVYGLTQGLKLGNQFKNQVEETFALSNAIQKLAAIFGLGKEEFVDFQTTLTKGLGDIGISTEAAVNALKGLSETQVRGKTQLTEYSKAAGLLAGIGGEKGREGEIAKGMAGVITARGGNVNDIGSMKGLADDLRKAFNATGAAPTKILSQLETIMASMPTDLRKSISSSGLVKLAATSAIAGPNSTKFIEEYLSKSPIARKALEARGFKDVFSEKGLNVEKFRSAAKSTIGAFPGDPRLMAQSLGLSEDAAEGFIRLYESLDKVDSAQKRMDTDNKSLENQFINSMGAMEAFNASLSKFKASLAQPIAWSTTMLTEGLQKAFKTSLTDVLNWLPTSIGVPLKEMKEKLKEYLPEAVDKNLGSTAVVAGGAGLAALLTGQGLKNLFKLGQSKVTGVAERVAYEQITGAKVQDVYVVNAKEIGQGSSTNIPGMESMGKKGKLLGTVGKVATAAVGFAGGLEIGEQINSAIAGTEVDQKLNDVAGNLGKQFGDLMNKLSPSSKTINNSTNVNNTNTNQQKNTSMKTQVDVNVKFETKTLDIKATKKGSRSVTQ